MKEKIAQTSRKISDSIGWFFYSFGNLLHRPFAQRKPSRMNEKTKRLVFYILLMAYPVVQFLIFYIVVNANSLLLAFESYDRSANRYLFVGWANFENFATLFQSDSTFRDSLKNSALVWLIGLASIPLNLVFSFYIYKKKPVSGFFKVMLFLPSIVPSIALVVIYLFFVERAVPSLLGSLTGNSHIEGLLTNSSTLFGTLVFFNIAFGFGSGMLLFLGAMNQVSPEVIEAAHLDGATGLRELVSIILPNIYGTISSFLVLGVAGIFAEQYCLYSFFGNAADPRYITVGYYLFTQTASASLAEYPKIAAIGLALTLIAAPLTFLAKGLLQRVDPLEDKR